MFYEYGRNNSRENNRFWQPIRYENETEEKVKVIHKFRSKVSILTMTSVTKYRIQQGIGNKPKAEKNLRSIYSWKTTRVSGEWKLMIILLGLLLALFFLPTPDFPTPHWSQLMRTIFFYHMSLATRNSYFAADGSRLELGQEKGVKPIALL